MEKNTLHFNKYMCAMFKLFSSEQYCFFSVCPSCESNPSPASCQPHNHKLKITVSFRNDYK